MLCVREGENERETGREREKERERQGERGACKIVHIPLRSLVSSRHQDDGVLGQPGKVLLQIL
jgi:hypothetical protein